MNHREYLNELATITEDDGFKEDAEKIRQAACEIERLRVIIQGLAEYENLLPGIEQHPFHGLISAVEAAEGE